MAANFWDSTHRHALHALCAPHDTRVIHRKLLVRQEDVQNSHFKDRARGITHKQIQQMTVYFVKCTHYGLWCNRVCMTTASTTDMQHLVRATNGVLRQRCAVFMWRTHAHHCNNANHPSSYHHQGFSHRVAATAAVYFQRFYLRNDFAVWDPRHIAPACVYLSSKTEESPLQAKFLLQYIRSLSSTCSCCVCTGSC